MLLKCFYQLTSSDEISKSFDHTAYNSVFIVCNIFIYFEKQNNKTIFKPIFCWLFIGVQKKMRANWMWQTVAALHRWLNHYITSSCNLGGGGFLFLKLFSSAAIQCVISQCLSCLSSSLHQWTCNLLISTSLKFWLVKRHLHHSLILKLPLQKFLLPLPKWYFLVQLFM